MNAVQSLPLDRARLEAVVREVLDQARKAGASAAEAAVSCDDGLSVNVRLGEVETLEYHRDQGVGVTVYFGNRKGSASTSDLKSEALRETVEAAARIARYTAEDPCAGLADAALMAHDYPDLDLDHPWALEAEDAIVLARDCEAAAMQADARINNSEGSELSTFRGTAIYGNSHGFIGGYTGTRHSLSCTVVAEDEGGMQRDYWYSVARDRSALESPAEVGRHAAERTLRRLGARRLSTREAPILFAPELARGVIGHFVAAIRGGALYRKASFLLDALGEPLFPGFVRVHERPHLQGALGSAPFDGEGVRTGERDVVSGGVLQGYVLDSYSARKLGLVTTGNAGGVHNLLIEPGSVTGGTTDQTGLLKEMGTGLLVTELIGHGVNTVTGDYSRGAAGYWVENGELAWPVEEITVAGNLRDVFRRIVAVGSDVDARGNIQSGSLLVERMTIAGE